MAEDREIVSAEANFGKTHGVSSDVNVEETRKKKTEKINNDLRAKRLAIFCVLVLYLVVGLFLNIPLLFLPILGTILLGIAINAYIEREKKKKKKTTLILVKPFIIFGIVSGLITTCYQSMYVSVHMNLPKQNPHMLQRE